MKEILDVIHKTIYQFFDICGDDEEVPMSDKDKLLLEVNKAICNNLEVLEKEPCEDVIDRTEAVTEIMMFAGNVKSDEEGVYIKVSDVVQLLRELPPRHNVTPQPKTGHWIDVNERLPEKNVEVLVTTEWNCITIGEMISSNDWFINEGATNADIDDIKAWMPLPAPFEPQEKSDKK